MSTSTAPTTQATATAVAGLKEIHRATWAAGDYAAVAETIDTAPPRDLLAAAAIAAGQDVLDVATGTGNAALQAAARGATVTGLDLTPSLLQTARRRATAAGATISWVEGGAEAMPFADAAFDRVMSVFGIQFAPRHRVVAQEMVRVCRPGGRIALVNWTPAGLIGQLLKIIGSRMPAPPAFASPPPLWGDEGHVTEMFDGLGVRLGFSRGHNPWRFDSAEHFVHFFEMYYGPVLKASERLAADGRWEECRAQIIALARRHDEGDGDGLFMRAEYLVVTADRVGDAG